MTQGVRISSLTAITGASTAAGDMFVIDDVSATEMKSITRDELAKAMSVHSTSTPSFAGVYLGGGADLLDTYEEGTFTPTIADAASGGNTGTTGTGRYTRVGRIVQFNVVLNNIDTTGLTSGNTLYITGMPFTFRSKTAFPIDATKINRGADTYTALTARGISGGTNIKIQCQFLDGSVARSLTVGEVTLGTTDITITGVYEAA